MHFIGYSPFNMWPFEMSALEDEQVKAVAHEVERSAAQVLIRWTLQLGVAPLTRSSSKEHMAENLRVTDFELSEPQMQRITGIIRLSQWFDAAWVADVYGVQQVPHDTSDSGDDEQDSALEVHDEDDEDEGEPPSDDVQLMHEEL